MAPVPGRPGERLDRGFARLPEPALDQLRALPQLTDVRIRMSADGPLRVDDGPNTLFDGAGYRASDAWHAAARAGGLTLLVDPLGVAAPARHDRR